jgi:hypothetical protein
MVQIEFAPLLNDLSDTSSGARLAKLSIQTKVEKFVLAEIAFAGESRHPQLEFWLEELRRDLTVRRVADNGRGPLIEWVEAKMCYSDCVARAITKKKRVEEYCELVAQDAAKQDQAELPPADLNATLTVALFVFHREEPHPRHVYYPAFKNRGNLSHEQIKQEAFRFCTEDIPQRIERSLAESFAIHLDPTTEMLCFFYRRAVPT